MPKTTANRKADSYVDIEHLNICDFKVQEHYQRDMQFEEHDNSSAELINANFERR
jgi:hypothetical protein